ncbi:sigma-70 family RNA polymerase sigma factor [Paenibacillus qinlingensis]|uniref:RNA polymerase sigma factor (Sigma-70 family) n=1 Tax=Paenibacillus qinlingensis TaxID=1837343 RepID=A0ABU1P1R8_9BACL|nr:sigma-70 family RNA polymerase sigma factor [Paenibacillus qinlingensis]MDR6553690.1 RNA polymerase sigma factor (sigma-70 family) [Paenibacillus qinlingensis]
MIARANLSIRSFFHTSAGVQLTNFVYSCGEEEKHIEEHSLVDRIVKGDEAAFRELVIRYRPYILQTIFAIVRHQKDAEDLSQEVWTRIYFSLPQYEKKGLKTWMTRIAVNRAIDFKRASSRRKEDIIAEFEEAVTPTGQAPPHLEHSVEHEVLIKETTEFIRHKLDQIPSNYQDVLLAYYIHHQSYQDIANAQGVTIKTVESKLYRAKQWVRNRWKEEEFR